MKSVFAWVTIILPQLFIMLVMQSACGGANSFSASNSKPTAIKSNFSEGAIEDRNPEGHVDSDAFSEQVGVEDTGTIESTSSVSIGCEQYTEKTKMRKNKEKNIFFLGLLPTLGNHFQCWLCPRTSP